MAAVDTTAYPTTGVIYGRKFFVTLTTGMAAIIAQGESKSLLNHKVGKFVFGQLTLPKLFGKFFFVLNGKSLGMCKPKVFELTDTETLELENPF